MASIRHLEYKERQQFVLTIFRKLLQKFYQDLSAFSKDEFDPKDWINKTFQCPEAQADKEEYATTIVAKLRSFIQEVNISLEKTAEQVNQNFPRIAREIEVMQNEAKLLQQQMSSVKGDVIVN